MAISTFLRPFPLPATLIGNIIVNNAVSDLFDYSIASGDLAGDGAADLIIGARSHNVTDHPTHFADAGAVYVFYGTAPGKKIYLPLIAK